MPFDLDNGSQLPVPCGRGFGIAPLPRTVLHSIENRDSFSHLPIPVNSTQRLLINHHSYLASALASAMAIVLGIRTVELVAIVSPTPRSPIETPQTHLTRQSPVQSPAELYQLRNFLQGEIDRVSTILDRATFAEGVEYERLMQERETLIEQIQAVEAQIKLNESAGASWDKALNLAALAAQMGKSRRPSIETWQQARLLWDKSLTSLRTVPSNSFIKARADEKIPEYEKHLATANDKLEIAQSKLLGSILERNDLSADAMMTICKLPGECRHWRGDRSSVNPASLMKVPIAVALLHKVTAENISLDRSIYIQSGNFTEDGRGNIQVKRYYALRTILKQAIARSSNIASNQLIDYLGWDYIDRVLSQRGYRVARVSSKFMGQKVMPANPGKASNRLTSNELTRMMVEIYNRKHPHDDVLIAALSDQRDRSLGFSALRETPARWLGEKTGESSKVRGTTLAFKLAGETYIITLIDNHGYRDANIRRCLAQTVNYIAQYGYF